MKPFSHVVAIFIVTPILTLGMLVVFRTAVMASGRDAMEVVRQHFPVCFEKAKPGQTSGADCKYDPKQKEWQINYWTCAGTKDCAPKKFTAWYRVDKKGAIQKCSGDLSEPDRIYSCEPFSTFSYRKEPADQGIKKLVAEDSKLFCNKTDDCFWYACCERAPMSKLYSRKHYQELFMSKPEQQTCEAKCMHDPVPKGVKLECVAHMCMSVSDSLPAIDPDRPVLWIGRPEVVGQCEQGLMPMSPLKYAGAPIIIRETDSPEITIGPEFNKKTSDWQKQAYDSNPGKFQCEACHVCKDFRTRYLLIFFTDLDKFTKGPDTWWRADQ